MYVSPVITSRPVEVNSRYPTLLFFVVDTFVGLLVSVCVRMGQIKGSFNHLCISFVESVINAQMRSLGGIVSGDGVDFYKNIRTQAIIQDILIQSKVP